MISDGESVFGLDELLFDNACHYLCDIKIISKLGKVIDEDYNDLCRT